MLDTSKNLDLSEFAIKKELFTWDHSPVVFHAEIGGKTFLAYCWDWDDRRWADYLLFPVSERVMAALIANKLSLRGAMESVTEKWAMKFDLYCNTPAEKSALPFIDTLGMRPPFGKGFSHTYGTLPDTLEEAEDDTIQCHFRQEF